MYKILFINKTVLYFLKQGKKGQLQVVSEKELKTLFRSTNAALSLLIYNKMQRHLNVKATEIKKVVESVNRRNSDVETFVEDVKKQLNIQVAAE